MINMRNLKAFVRACQSFLTEYLEDISVQSCSAKVEQQLLSQSEIDCSSICVLLFSVDQRVDFHSLLNGVDAFKHNFCLSHILVSCPAAWALDRGSTTPSPSCFQLLKQSFSRNAVNSNFNETEGL